MRKILITVIGLALGLAFFVPGNASAATKKSAKLAYDYQWVNQSASVLNLQPGEVTKVWIELKNTGTNKWEEEGEHAVRLGAGSNSYGASNQKQDYSSEAYGPFWRSSNRTSSFDYGVRDGVDGGGNIILPPGYNARFTINIKAPLTPGVYKAYFTPVVEGITWMKDIGIYWQMNVISNGSPETINLENGETKKVKIGDHINIVIPAETSEFNYDQNILEIVSADNFCDNSVSSSDPSLPYSCDDAIAKKGLSFDVIGEGFSAISVVGFSANIVSGRDYYSYDGSTQSSGLFNAKQGDIIIVNLVNPGDGGYMFAEPEFPTGRIRLIDHKHFAPANLQLVGDFGSDQWVFEVLDGGISNYIQIRSYRPWVGGDSFTSFLLNINPVIPCASGLTGCAF